MYPKVRFRGFDEPWKNKKFLTFSSKITKNSTSDDIDFPRIEFENIVSGEGKLAQNRSKLNHIKSGIKFDKGDILFGKLRPYLKNWWLAEFPGVAVGDFWVIRAKDNRYFLYYLIQAPLFEKVSNYTTGTKMPRSDWNYVSNTFFKLPKIDEQEKIGRILDKVDSLLSLQQRKLELISALEKGLGQIIKQQNNKYGITFSLNNFLEIPPQIQARIKNKNQLLTVKLNLQGIARGVQRDTLSLGSTKYFIRHTGELIFGKQNIFNGSIALITKEFDGLATSNDVPSLKISNINPQFLFYLLKNPDFWKHTELIATGTGSKRVHIHDLLKLHIKIIPDAKYQAKIVSLSRNFEKIVLNQQIIVKECEKTKQFLLQNLFI
ncbi:type I restriction modification DNA specificity domain protein [Lactobacillus jensenii SJ-7A-US]|uniref:restriction endonuclease subunit S n=1 Tax=Lactobacillus jensenii TaxID=109790 RepID=UPI0001B95FE2|nr:restriction endonuclease subunit S [Lactobacillus jensenii]EEX27529.1 type I restriction modification DNA specificity domain protein [Lactobacillus jensenii SJ-7A-US]MCW8072027.1 restriction endonuclease subunit S [Lactobacillus jensenii]